MEYFTSFPTSSLNLPPVQHLSKTWPDSSRTDGQDYSPPWPVTTSPRQTNRTSHFETFPFTPKVCRLPSGPLGLNRFSRIRSKEPKQSPNWWLYEDHYCRKHTLFYNGHLGRKTYPDQRCKIQERGKERETEGEGKRGGESRHASKRGKHGQLKWKRLIEL